jgi:transcriptional regulator with PAS, ATPase and Fis domain
MNRYQAEKEKIFFRLQELAVNSDANVLITGATGTGKTRLAEIIHSKSQRRSRPFVIVNLAALHEGTLESELFGHEKGAFTGAFSKKTGLLQMAEGGTVFFDEIGELPIRLQARLLQFIQTKKLCPVGSTKEIKLDVRIISATNRNLLADSGAGLFREDLFHRLRVISIHLSPLNERVDDLDTLVHRILGEVCREVGKTVLKLSSDVANLFEAYHWPGNIRELRNVIEYAVIASDTGEIKVEHLPAWLLPDKSAGGVGHLMASTLFGQEVLAVEEVPLLKSYHDTLVNFEKLYLRKVYERNRGRINRTAREIGMNKTTLLRRLRAFGISESCEKKQNASISKSDFHQTVI